MADRVIQRLGEMQLQLPARCEPRGNFVPFKRSGTTVYLAGQICEWNGEIKYQGQVGKDLDLETAREAARICALNLLFHLRDACGGSLERVSECLRVGGFVNCVPGFPSPPAVINGASDLFIALFGEAGRHARTAIGVASLPGNAAVEVDAIFALRS
jgi:enamine deaminase RidA (YjgF/YER057c/UK114 family)